MISKNKFCECGCKNKIIVKYWHTENNFPRFIRGHHIRINNPSSNPKIMKKILCSKKRNGTLNHTIETIKKIRSAHLGKPMNFSKKELERRRKLMKTNNPMFKRKNQIKISKLRKELWKTPTKNMLNGIEKGRKKRIGRKLSEETKRKISINHPKKGHPMYSNPERNRKISIANKGRFVSEETKKKIRKIRLGTKATIETKLKMSKKHKGKKLNLSKKEIRRRSKMILGDKNPAKRPEIRKKISETNKIVMQNTEIRRKISLSTKRNMKKPERKLLMQKVRLNTIIPYKDTSIEIKMQKELIKHKIKFKKHYSIFGQPDIFIEPNICIFCDGDYWHNYPKGNNRDKEVNKQLKKDDYIVIRFWGSEIRTNTGHCVQKILNIINVLDETSSQFGGKTNI